ncbi:MAG: RIP metalloprotease RseP [Candidatus Omnitrophica bacterium]|nr:RIP metalloprotease RseP [Candidatus Omnitrophota bacterium]
MITLLIFIIILSVLIVVHEFGHFIVAKKIGVKVEKFSLGFGPQLFKRKKDDTEYSVAAIPLGGYVKLAGDNLEEYKGNSDEYLSKPPGKRFWVIFFGPLLNYVLGFLCFWIIFFVGYPKLTAQVGGLLDGFGAKDAGVQVNDKIISVDGRKVAFWEDIQEIMKDKKAAQTVQLSILRQGKEITLGVNIKEKKVDDLLGDKLNVGLLGITPSGDAIVVKHGLFGAFSLGLNRTWFLTVMTYKALWRMVLAKISIREATGPLGIFFITGKVAQQGIVAVLNFVGLISVSLAIFNLLPLPVLDGGHILLLAIEKIRGKYLSLKAERIIMQIGFTFIITLAIIVTYNDLMRVMGR